MFSFPQNRYRRFFYAFDKTFTVIAASVPVNLGNYFIGIIAAMVYLNLRRKSFDLSQKKVTQLNSPQFQYDLFPFIAGVFHRLVPPGSRLHQHTSPKCNVLLERLSKTITLDVHLLPIVRVFLGHN